MEQARHSHRRWVEEVPSVSNWHATLSVAHETMARLFLPLLVLLSLTFSWGCSVPDAGDEDASDDDSTPSPGDGDGDGEPAATDCDDGDATTWPGALESCDGKDNDCDGEIDEDFDLDEDGFFTQYEALCAATWGEADCQDGDPQIHPGAVEVCDSRDQNCDGQADEGFDEDEDGFTSCNGDCDDQNPAVHLGVSESCNGLDDDCDGQVDAAWDEDGDGIAPCAGDCNDLDPTVSPAAEEVCDRLDNNCDLVVDEGFDVDGDGFPVCRGDCDDEDPATNPFAVEVCDGKDNDCHGGADDVFDLDGDGSSQCDEDPDCNDGDPSVNPLAEEVCNGVDDDCDGVLFEGEEDADEDGSLVCQGDCDDENPDRGSGFDEICDGIDNDCDPLTLEDEDGDEDGYTACGGDCDEGDPERSPDSVEACNGMDDDCDGTVENGIGECHSCGVWTRDGVAYLTCPLYLDYESARESCQEAGYHLVTIQSNGENTFVFQIAWEVSEYAWYIGYDDLEEEGVFRWVEGESEFTRWAGGEPNNYGDEDCGSIGYFGTAEWNDYPCASLLPFLCEAEP